MIRNGFPPAEGKSDDAMYDEVSRLIASCEFLQ